MHQSSEVAVEPPNLKVLAIIRSGSERDSQHFLLSQIVTMKTILSILIFCCWVFAATVTQAERPNIIMFLIDDQNPSSIAAFGGDTYTPNSIEWQRKA